MNPIPPKLEQLRKAVQNRSTAVIGYGTLITRKEYHQASGVEPVFVSGYRRVLPSGNWYPFVLHDPDYEGFWALKFIVSLPRLYEIDAYEGVSGGLYYRRKIAARRKDGNFIFAYIYLPTVETQKRQQLHLGMDPTDRWKEKIANHPDIVAEFPELLWSRWSPSETPDRDPLVE